MMITYEVYIAHWLHGNLHNIEHATVSVPRTLRPRTILEHAQIDGKPECRCITNVYHGDFMRRKEDVGLSHPVSVGKLLDANQVRMDRSVPGGALLFVY